jgi:hypothetical protein
MRMDLNRKVCDTADEARAKPLGWADDFDVMKAF